MIGTGSRVRGPAAGGAGAEQDDGHLVGRGARAREGAQVDRHRRCGRRRVRVRRRVRRVRHEGHAPRGAAAHPAARGRGLVAGGGARLQEARHRRDRRREAQRRQGRARTPLRFTVEAGSEKQDIEVEKVLVAAGRAPNVEKIGLKEVGVQLTDRGFIKIDERMAHERQGHLRHRRRRRSADAGAQGRARGDGRRRGDRGKDVPPGELRQHPERDVLPSRGRVDRADRGAVQGEEARLQGRPVPLQRERARAHVGRDRGIREDHLATRSTARFWARTSSARTRRS